MQPFQFGALESWSPVANGLKLVENLLGKLANLSFLCSHQRGERARERESEPLFPREVTDLGHKQLMKEEG
jgi:hypothetical protein